MTPPSAFPSPFTLGPWLVQAELNRITGPDGTHQIEPRIMRVLLVLAALPGGVVTRQRLLDEVWTDTIVGEEILTRAISELRRVFGDDARTPAYIETIRHHGYRLIMPVTEPTPEPAVAVAPAATVPVAAAAPETSPDATPEAAAQARRLTRALIARAVPLLAVLLVVVLGVTAPRWWPDATRRPGPLPAPVPLTSYPGRELHPALVPDGTQVAFAWAGPDGRTPGIYVKQRNSETALRLTAEPGWPAWPVWLPDGQSVAFVQTTDTLSAICVVPSLGGPVRRLRQVASLVDGLTVASDGSRLVWSARSPGGGPYRLEGLALGDPTAVWQPVPPTGPAGDVQPRLSPDGHWLAWVALGPGGEGTIYRAPTAGGPARPMVRARGPVGGLAWTPSGAALVYGAAPAGVYGLWLVAGDGGDPRPLPLPAEFAWNPTVAAASGDLAYEQARLDHDIWSLRVVGRDPWRLETAPFLVSTRWEADADLDPVRGGVVFVSMRSGSSQLWLARPDGTDPAPLTDLNGAALSGPRWSPDGTRVAFRAVTGERAEIMVVPAAGGRPRAVPLEADDALPCGWTRDGRALLVAADLGDGWQIHRLDPVDGARQVVTTAGGLSAAEAVDGRHLYHTRPGLAGLWRLPLGTGGEPELVIPGLPAGDRAAWRLSGTIVHWVLRVRGGAVLMRHELDNDRSSPVAELPGYASGGLAVSPQGDVVLYTHAGEVAGDLMFVEGFAEHAD